MITMRQLESLVAAQEHDRAGRRSVGLLSATEDFYLSGAADGMSDATLRWYRSLLGAFAADMGADDPACKADEITSEEIRAYIVRLRKRTTRYQNAPQRPPTHGALSESTIAGHITALHAFFGWCSREYGFDNPMRNIARPKPAAPSQNVVTADTFRRLFDACKLDSEGDRDRAMLALLMDSGIRVGGLVGMRVGHIDLKGNRAQVTEKGNKSRTVHWTSYTSSLIQRWLNVRDWPDADALWISMTTGNPLTTSGVEQVLRRLKKQAGVRGAVNPHAFRHAFAREYLRAGGDAITLARLIGHANVNTTAAHYAIFNEDELAELHQARSPMLAMKAAGS